MVDVLIVGGGLAGLVNAIHLSNTGLKVIVLEKNDFPKHKVCGEYISNEVLPYLEQLGIHPFRAGATAINQFLLSTPTGVQVETKLPLGGFGISRYTLDHLLYQTALANGCVVEKAMVEKIDFFGDKFRVSTRRGIDYFATFVIGAYGKRAALDIALNRKFIREKTPFLAVKCHYTGDFPNNLVALHNFEGGYCGVSKVENDLINVCYLANYKSFKPYRKIEAYQREVLFKNPHLKNIFQHLKMAFPQPISISQISFSTKERVQNHIFMSGDTAGMIHPLCGNGMGMAIHSAQILSNLLVQYFNGRTTNRQELEQEYIAMWNQTFRKRLTVGRFLNFFLATPILLEKGIPLLRLLPNLLPFIIKQTHGEVLRV